MFKIVCVVDKIGTALDRLGKGVAPYHDNIDYKVVDVHPKRPDHEQIQMFEAEAIDADIIDWQYYRTAEMLRSKYDWLADKKHILTHNNPYSIEESDWNTYDMNVGNNKYITNRLGEITQQPIEYIPLTVDTDFWTFNPDWKPNKNVIMVANRIESKKGILPVAIACAELNLHFILVGSVSDRSYLESILACGNNVEFHEQVSDEKLKELYYKSSIHVCNSKDNFESGTLPILEAMLCGVPVMTRRVGHVPELYNGDNMVIYEGDYEDPLGVQDAIFSMISDKKKLESIRNAGWQTAKSRSHERRAYLYQKLYRQVFYESSSVSVVVPAYNKPENLRECLDAIDRQTYKNIEIIVADDNPFQSNEPTVRDFAKYTNKPVRYINTSRQEDDYGLARARNEATIEATGEIMVYMDQRQIPEPEAVEEFVNNLKPRFWLFGNKGVKKEFVENFSCIFRGDIIDAGMFCERMDCYGGLSQECRVRFRNQGIQTEFIESAKATPRGKSSNRNRKRKEIIRSKNRLFKMGLE